MKLELAITLDDDSYDSAKRFSFDIPYGVRDDDAENKLVDLLNAAVNWEDVVSGLCLEVQAKMPVAPDDILAQQLPTAEQLSAAQNAASQEELAETRRKERVKEVAGIMEQTLHEAAEKRKAEQK